jgi:hypothetical protein
MIKTILEGSLEGGSRLNCRDSNGHVAGPWAEAGKR